MSSFWGVLYISEILSYNSFEDAKKAIIDSEIDEVLRDNHLEQLHWFEKRGFGNSYDKEQIIKEFVEITQRRNLFVHSDGKVTMQYINCCKEIGYKLSTDLTVGCDLMVQHSYHVHACNVIEEVGLKLAILV